MIAASALFLAAAALASVDRDGEIVVTTESLQDQAISFVRQVQNREQENDEPIARFADAVCVGSAGLPENAAQTVIDRVSEVARSVGLATGAPGCAPNIMIVFTDNTAEAVHRLSRIGSRAIASQPLAAIAKIAKERGNARAWTEVETRTRDGEKMLLAPNEPAILNISSQSRLVAPIRRDIVSATVLIERDATAGRSLHQIADYAAVRALSGAQARDELEGSSILATFTPAGDAQAPPEMTSLDRGYLRGLYAGEGNILPAMKKRQIARQIVAELTGAPPGATAPGP